VSIARFIGLDLVWRENLPGRVANETGVAVLDSDGRVIDAGWTRRLHETVNRTVTAAGPSALLFIDAPLVLDNPSGQRPCETQVGQALRALEGQRQRHQPALSTPSRRHPAGADLPLRLDSHPVTRQLVVEPSPLNDTAYKHREDLIDALLCAWTAALWSRHGHRTLPSRRSARRRNHPTRSDHYRAGKTGTAQVAM
jgi:predicted RNase H-like nuclease